MPWWLSPVVNIFLFWSHHYPTLFDFSTVAQSIDEGNQQYLFTNIRLGAPDLESHVDIFALVRIFQTLRPGSCHSVRVDIRQLFFHACLGLFTVQDVEVGTQ